MYIKFGLGFSTTHGTMRRRRCGAAMCYDALAAAQRSTSHTYNVYKQLKFIYAY